MEKKLEQENITIKQHQQQQQEFLSNNVLTMQTIQVAPFKTLFTALKDIIVDTNIIITKSGLKIIDLDSTHSVLVYLDLPAKNFELFDCKKDKIVIGVELSHLFKILNFMDPHDTMTIYIDNTDYNDGVVSYLSFKFDNKVNKQCSTYKLNLMESNDESDCYPDIVYSSVITFPSANFQKIIKNFMSLSSHVDIISVDNCLKFKTSGSIGVGDITFTESENMSFTKKDNPSKIIQGTFSLKQLSYFIKCTNLCTQIEIYLDNELPLITEYAVASLGTLRLGLSPRNDNV